MSLVAVVCGQYEMKFGGLVPQTGVKSTNIVQKSNNVVCLNVEITQDILLRGIDYYVSNARSEANIIANVRPSRLKIFQEVI